MTGASFHFRNRRFYLKTRCRVFDDLRFWEELAEVLITSDRQEVEALTGNYVFEILERYKENNNEQ